MKTELGVDKIERLNLEMDNRRIKRLIKRGEITQHDLVLAFIVLVVEKDGEVPDAFNSDGKDLYQTCEAALDYTAWRVVERIDAWRALEIMSKD